MNGGIPESSSTPMNRSVLHAAKNDSVPVLADTSIRRLD